MLRMSHSSPPCGAGTASTPPARESPLPPRKTRGGGVGGLAATRRVHRRRVPVGGIPLRTGSPIRTQGQGRRLIVIQEVFGLTDWIRSSPINSLVTDSSPWHPT